jgi:manganese/iron transport system permease protein
VSVGFGWFAVVAGLTISYHADTAASATVAGVAVCVFFVVLIAIELVAWLRRLRPPADAAPAST